MLFLTHPDLGGFAVSEPRVIMFGEVSGRCGGKSGQPGFPKNERLARRRTRSRNRSNFGNGGAVSGD